MAGLLSQSWIHGLVSSCKAKTGVMKVMNMNATKMSMISQRVTHATCHTCEYK